jgi:hypothetical protein
MFSANCRGWKAAGKRLESGWLNGWLLFNRGLTFEASGAVQVEALSRVYADL